MTHYANGEALREDFTRCVNTYQAPILTEFATLGIACLLTHARLNSQITEVTRRGERVDYWIDARAIYRPRSHNGVSQGCGSTRPKTAASISSMTT